MVRSCLYINPNILFRTLQLIIFLYLANIIEMRRLLRLARPLQYQHLFRTSYSVEFSFPHLPCFCCRHRSRTLMFTQEKNTAWKWAAGRSGSVGIGLIRSGAWNSQRFMQRAYFAAKSSGWGNGYDDCDSQFRTTLPPPPPQVIQVKKGKSKKVKGTGSACTKNIKHHATGFGGDVYFTNREVISFLGSCFSDNISLKLKEQKFRTIVNPYGTLYNPISIQRSIRSLLKTVAHEEEARGGEWSYYKAEDIFFNPKTKLYFSFNHHSDLSRPTAEGALEALQIAALHAAIGVRTGGKGNSKGNNCLGGAMGDDLQGEGLASAGRGAVSFRESHTVCLTLGTAWVYDLILQTAAPTPTPTAAIATPDNENNDKSKNTNKDSNSNSSSNSASDSGDGDGGGGSGDGGGITAVANCHKVPLEKDLSLNDYATTATTAMTAMTATTSTSTSTSTSSTFRLCKRLLSVEEVERALTKCIDDLIYTTTTTTSTTTTANTNNSSSNNDVTDGAPVDNTFALPRLRQIVLTLSPVRHTKDGIVENMRSKSILHVAIQNVVESYNQQKQKQKQKHHHKQDQARLKQEEGSVFVSVSYFPSYEIMVDDLRDYRFYSADLIHPSDTAIDYIHKRFMHTYCHPESRENVAPKMLEITKAMKHRPLHRNTEPFKLFVKAQIAKIERLQEEYAEMDIDLSAELKHFKDMMTETKNGI